MSKFSKLSNNEKAIAKKCINKKIKDIYYCAATESYYIELEDKNQLVVSNIRRLTT